MDNCPISPISPWDRCVLQGFLGGHNASEPQLPTVATHSLAYALLAFLLSLPHSPTPHLGVLPLPELYPGIGVQMLSVSRFPQTYLSSSQHSARDEGSRTQGCPDQGHTRSTQYFLLSASFLQPGKSLFLQSGCFALIILSCILPNLYLCHIPC